MPPKKTHAHATAKREHATQRMKKRGVPPGRRAVAKNGHRALVQAEGLGQKKPRASPWVSMVECGYNSFVLPSPVGASPKAPFVSPLQGFQTKNENGADPGRWPGLCCVRPSASNYPGTCRAGEHDPPLPRRARTVRRVPGVTLWSAGEADAKVCGAEGGTLWRSPGRRATASKCGTRHPTQARGERKSAATRRPPRSKPQASRLKPALPYRRFRPRTRPNPPRPKRASVAGSGTW